MFRTLLVDDNLQFRAALHDALHARFPFCEVSGADGVQSGLDKALRLRPDLIIVDLMLVDGSGLDLIRRLRAMRVASPIVALTIHELPEYRDEALRSGADHYFAKLPTSVADIYRYVDGLLAGRLRGLVICGDAALGEALGTILDSRCPDMVSVRTEMLEDGVLNGRLLKPQLVLFHSGDDAERETLYCQALRIAWRDNRARIVCVRNAERGSLPIGVDHVLTRAQDFENHLLRIVAGVRAEHFPRPVES
jgi:DNA-binding NarL/FixJ family response regulator